MYHLAQANYAQWKQDLPPQNLQKFLEFANHINVSAGNNKDLIWQNPAGFFGDKEVIQEFGNPHIILNLSVWKTLDALKAFVYQNIHGKAMQNRELWFDSLDKQVYVLWWVKLGHQPTIAEAKTKFELLEQAGPTAQAFTFRQSFDCPSPL